MLTLKTMKIILVSQGIVNNAVNAVGFLDFLLRLKQMQGIDIVVKDEIYSVMWYFSPVPKVKAVFKESAWDIPSRFVAGKVIKKLGYSWSTSLQFSLGGLQFSLRKVGRNG